MNEILETTKYVVDNSNSVSINNDALVKVVGGFNHKDTNHWLNETLVDFGKFTDNEKLNFILVFSAISFSYWGDPKWTVEYEGKEIDGSYGLVTALKRATDENIPILDPKYLAVMTENDLEHVLRANTQIPMLKERLKILNEIGNVLVNKYECDFGSMVERGEKDVNKLRKVIVNELPSFKDSTSYKGKTIFFHKRVQVLISDMYELFGGKSYGEFINPEELTAGADYKLPQILRKLGILSYGKKLAEKIDNKIPLVSESEEETEIRANTIWVVEFMKKELQKKGVKISSMAINDHLWLLTQTKQQDDKPYHLVRTQKY